MNSIELVKLCELLYKIVVISCFLLQCSSYVGELQKPRGGGPIFFSAEGGLILKNRGGQGGSLRKFSLEFYMVKYK